MGWGMSIGIGWPNASAYSGPLIPQESYNMYNCVQDEYQTSNPYPVGNFAPGDRVSINDGEFYGYIIEPFPPISGNRLTELGIGNQGIGCNDSTVSISLQLNADGDGRYSVIISASLPGGANLPVVSEGNIEMYIEVYANVTFRNEDGDRYGRDNYVAIIPSYYNIQPNDTIILGQPNIFNVNPTWYIDEIDSLIVNVLNLQTGVINVFDISDGERKWLTNYGNVWTFLFPAP